MGRRKSRTKITKSNKSLEDDISVEPGAAEIDASKSVMVDASENNIVSQSESEGQTVVETEKENSLVVFGCSQVEKNTMDAAEDEHIHQQHAAEEADMVLEKVKVDMELGEAEGEERLDENGDEVSDNDDNSDFNEAEEELDEYDDNEDNVESDEYDVEDEDGGDEEDEDDSNDDDDDVFVADAADEDDDDEEEEAEEEENVFLIEEDEKKDEEITEPIKVEDSNDTSKQADENQGNAARQGENTKEEDDERGGENLRKLENDDDTLKEGDENERNRASQGENAGKESEEKGVGNLAKLENNDDTLKVGDENQRNKAAQGENAKKESEDRGGGSLKKKKSLMKVKERKKITLEVSDKVASRQNKREEEDGGNDAVKETDKANENENIQDKEGTSKQKFKKLRKGRRKVAAEISEKGASKQDDKSSPPKKVKSMGMIFMCSSKTKKDCYNYKVFGLPASKKDLVGQIYKGMRLFLYDVDLKLLYGIYKAAGRGGYNIQPKAFNSQFPAQVRFTVLEDCLPLAEEKFKKVIKDNYFTKKKFDCQLTYQQVRDLCKLFASASKGSNAIRLATRARTHASTDRDRSRVRYEKRHSAMPEKRRYHEDSRSHEREVVPSTLKRRYHEVSRNHEREVVPSTLKRRYHEDSRTHEREVAASAVKRRYYHEDLRTRERVVVASPVKRRYHEDSRSHDRGVVASAVDRRYHEDSRNREREVVTSAVASMPIRLVPAAVAPPSYVYDRTLELDDYRPNLVVERRDSRVHLVPEPRLEQHPIIYRREPTLNQLDPYRRDVATEHLDSRLRDEIGRRDPYISYRERLEQHRDLPSRDDYLRRRDPSYVSTYIGSTAEDHNLRVEDELRRRDPYSPGERPAYRDRVYDTHQPRVTDQYLPASRTDYSSSSAVASLPEYRSVRSLYRY